MKDNISQNRILGILDRTLWLPMTDTCETKCFTIMSSILQDVNNTGPEAFPVSVF